MPNLQRGWLFEGDAQEELDRAIAECERDHGGSLHGDPTMEPHAIVLKDGSKFEGTVVFVDDDGWWNDYARVHAWPKLTRTRMRDLFGETEHEPPDSG